MCVYIYILISDSDACLLGEEVLEEGLARRGEDDLECVIIITIIIIMINIIIITVIITIIMIIMIITIIIIIIIIIVCVFVYYDYCYMLLYENDLENTVPSQHYSLTRPVRCAQLHVHALTLTRCHAEPISSLSQTAYKD